MQRRQFISASLAASALSLADRGAAQTPASTGREFYLIRRYNLQNGPQQGLTEKYFSDALIPALTRLGLGPVGAMRLEYGPETPAYYTLIPGAPQPACLLAQPRPETRRRCGVHKSCRALLERTRHRYRFPARR